MFKQKSLKQLRREKRKLQTQVRKGARREKLEQEVSTLKRTKRGYSKTRQVMKDVGRGLKIGGKFIGKQAKTMAEGFEKQERQGRKGKQRIRLNPNFF